MPGTRVDGGEFWQSAIAQGILLPQVSPQAAEKEILGTPRGPGDFQTWGKRHSSCRYGSKLVQLPPAYDYPAQNSKLIGVTGTKWKKIHNDPFNRIFLTMPSCLQPYWGLRYTFTGFEQTSAHIYLCPPNCNPNPAAALQSDARYSNGS